MSSRASRLVLAAILVVGPLAGCLEEAPAPAPVSAAEGPSLGALSAPIYESILRDTAVITGADNTRIWLDIFRPEAPEDVKLPIILVMTPYRALGNGLGGPGCVAGGCPYDQDLVDFFVPRGYAVAFSDVRGNHNSGGCIDQTGPKQWEDGFLTVEWLADLPWSNGRVGMYGISYDGETQQTTALLAPPHLATIVPASAVASQYDYFFFQGVPYELQGVSSMGAYLAISLLPGADPVSAPGGDPGSLPSYPQRFECQADNMMAALDLSGDETAYWKDREYRDHAAKLNTSILHVHGLADWNVKPVHIDGWFNNLTNASVKRALYGQWPHAFPQRDDWFVEGGILHRWFDHFLLGIDTGILEELPPVLIEDTEGEWRGLDSFPPLEQGWLTLHLNPDGSLSAAPGPAGEGVLFDAPRDLVETSDFRGDLEGARAGAGIPSRLVFESEPLAAPLRLTGVPLLNFTAITDKPSTHWGALLEVVKDGQVVTWENRGYQDTRHLQGTDKPADLTPGAAYNVTLRMYPQDDIVPAGARLRLTLSNDDDWVHQDPTAATSRLLLGEGGAVLALPLDPGGPAYPAHSLVRYDPGVRPDGGD